jgi:hypothetical protein
MRKDHDRSAERNAGSTNNTQQKKKKTNLGSPSRSQLKNASNKANRKICD